MWFSLYKNPYLVYPPTGPGGFNENPCAKRHQGSRALRPGGLDSIVAGDLQDSLPPLMITPTSWPLEGYRALAVSPRDSH